MSRVFRALGVFRPLNLLMIGFIQWVSFYFLNFNRQSSNVFDARFLIMSFALLCITAGGYAINDWFDRIPDSVNKPGKNHAESWPVWIFFSVYILLNALGIVLTFTVSNSAAVWVAGIAVSLLIYSAFIQKWPLIGNILVGLCTAFSVFEVYMVFGQQHFALILFFSIMAFLLTLSREFAKDMEDLEGDRLAGYRTYPIIAGLTSAGQMLRGFIFFTLIFFLLIHYQFIRHMFIGHMLTVYYAYQIACIAIPLIFLMSLAARAKSKEDAHQLSTWLKIIMLTGMGSAMLF